MKVGERLFWAGTSGMSLLQPVYVPKDVQGTHVLLETYKAWTCPKYPTQI